MKEPNQKADIVRLHFKNSTIWCQQETCFQIQRHKQVEIKRMKEIYHPNNNCKKSRMEILLSDKTDFNTKKIKEEEFYNDEIIKKRGIINIYVPSL